MMRLGSRFFLFLVVFSSFQFLGELSFAYIPPSQFILKSWLNKHSNIRSIRLKGNVVKYQNEKPTEYRFKETTVVNLENQTMKSWASDDLDHKLFVSEKSLSAVPLATRMLVSPSLQDMTQTLKKSGIPVRSKEELLELRTELEKVNSENEFLARWNSTIAWVIGLSEPKDVNHPQAWFEKDTFLLLRLLYETTTDNEFLDFRYENYKFYKELPFPRSLSVVKVGSGTLLVSQISEILVNVDNSKLIHANVGEPGFTAAGENASSGVKDLIRFYYADVR